MECAGRVAARAIACAISSTPGTAGSVVDGAVEDAVGVRRVARTRGAHPEVVVVRGVDQRTRGVCALQHADHVRRPPLLDRLQSRVDDARMPNGTGLLPRMRAAARSASRSLPARLAISRRGGVGHPRLELQRGLAFRRRQRVLRAAPGALHHLPRVGGGLVSVDQDSAGGALARGLLELVGPAAVVGQRGPGEELRLGGGGRRVVDHHQGDLALDVHALVVVPLVFRRDDAMADEHHLAGGGDLRVLHAAERDDVLQVLERRTRSDSQRERRRRPRTPPPRLAGSRCRRRRRARSRASASCVARYSAARSPPRVDGARPSSRSCDRNLRCALSCAGVDLVQRRTGRGLTALPARTTTARTSATATTDSRMEEV